MCSDPSDLSKHGTPRKCSDSSCESVVTANLKAITLTRAHLEWKLGVCVMSELHPTNCRETDVQHARIRLYTASSRNESSSCDSGGSGGTHQSVDCELYRRRRRCVVRMARSLLRRRRMYKMQARILWNMCLVGTCCDGCTYAHVRACEHAQGCRIQLAGGRERRRTHVHAIQHPNRWNLVFTADRWREGWHWKQSNAEAQQSPSTTHLPFTTQYVATVVSAAASSHRRSDWHSCHGLLVNIEASFLTTCTAVVT